LAVPLSPFTPGQERGGWCNVWPSDVATSPSRFAARFSASVGTSPTAYLARQADLDFDAGPEYVEREFRNTTAACSTGCSPSTPRARLLRSCARLPFANDRLEWDDPTQQRVL